VTIEPRNEINFPHDIVIAPKTPNQTMPFRQAQGLGEPKGSELAKAFGVADLVSR
jgi:hypothetical protein